MFVVDVEAGCCSSVAGCQLTVVDCRSSTVNGQEPLLCYNQSSHTGLRGVSIGQVNCRRCHVRHCHARVDCMHTLKPNSFVSVLSGCFRTCRHQRHMQSKTLRLFFSFATSSGAVHFVATPITTAVQVKTRDWSNISYALSRCTELGVAL